MSRPRRAAAVAIARLAALGLAVAAARGPGTVVRRLERLAPYAMIASGLYILADTPTDAL